MGRHGTIAGRKAAQDSKRAAMFTKYARAITVAAKAGGDPEYNSRKKSRTGLKTCSNVHKICKSNNCCCQRRR